MLAWMFSGDLTVPLFLLGLGAAILLTGISQAGWKHPLLIKGLFALGGIICLFGLFWPFFKVVIPVTLRRLIVSIGTDPESWFVALILALMAWMLPRHKREPSPAEYIDLTVKDDQKKERSVIHVTATETLAAKAKEEKKPARREYTNRTPEELLTLYRNHTAIQADKLFEPYIGMRMRIEGVVKQIYAIGNEYQIFFKSSQSERPYDVACTFSKDSQLLLMTLKSGDRLRLEGEVSTAQSHLALINCEIIDPPASPPPSPEPPALR